MTMEPYVANFTTIASLATLEDLTNFIHDGRNLSELLAFFDRLTETDRQYLYSSAKVSNLDELIELLQLSKASLPGGDSSVQVYPEDEFRKALLLYVPPVFIVLGTLGNLLSFIVLRCRAMMKVSSYHYLASLAIADTLVLYIGLLRLWVRELTGYDVSDSSDWACKLSISFGYIVSDLSVWLIIAVTVERYIVVCFPLRASSMINTRRAKVVIGCLVLLMFSINMHLLWTVELVAPPVTRNSSGKGPKCEAPLQHHVLVDVVWPWVDTFIYSFLPFVCITVLNVFIIREVLKARSHRLQMQNTPEHHFHQQLPRRRLLGGQLVAQGRNGVSSTSSANRAQPGSTTTASASTNNCRRMTGPGEGTKLTIMLLSVSFTFLLTTLPLNAVLIFTAFWNQQSPHHPQSSALFQLAKTITELMMYVNHSINFCLYCATGQKFRQQIVHLMRCRRDSGAYQAWTSVQTENTRFPASVRFVNSRPNERLLLAHVAAEDSDSLGDNCSVILKAKV